MSQNVYCRYVDGVFTPLEVEAMTDIVPVLQRTWKQRGYLRHHKHARASFNAHEVANIMALQIASQSLPVEMKFVHEAVAAAVPSILWFALSYETAWDFEGTAEQKSAVKKAIASDNKVGLQYLDKVLGLKKEQFGRYILLRSGGWEFVNSVDRTFDDEMTTAALVIDLIAIGRRLAKSPKRPRGLIIATDIEIGHKQDAPHVPAKKADGRK
jgi:hypothetical protein